MEEIRRPIINLYKKVGNENTVKEYCTAIYGIACRNKCLRDHC